MEEFKHRFGHSSGSSFFHGRYGLNRDKEAAFPSGSLNPRKSDPEITFGITFRRIVSASLKMLSFTAGFSFKIL